MRYLLLLLAACGVEQPDLDVATEAVTPCPKWGCGENSPVMGPFRFHELNLEGIPNDGITVESFIRDGVAYVPRIQNGSQLVASNADGTLAGKQLEGGYFRLLTQAGPYKLFVTHVTPKDVSPVHFWVGPATPIETYQLVYTGPQETNVPLCNSAPSRDAGEGGGHTWESPLEAILYTGDRYDADKKLVTASSYSTTEGWMVIGCAGSALAKLFFGRHATAASTVGFVTTPLQRQAMLKMYVSDICGKGVPFTTKGTPLHWTNAMHWMDFDGTEFAHEALWTASGALCLDTHRRGSEYIAAIKAACGGTLPHGCPASVPGQPLPLNAYLSTAVPFPVW